MQPCERDGGRDLLYRSIRAVELQDRRFIVHVEGTLCLREQRWFGQTQLRDATAHEIESEHVHLLVGSGLPGVSPLHRAVHAWDVVRDFGRAFEHEMRESQ